MRLLNHTSSHAGTPRNTASPHRTAALSHTLQQSTSPRGHSRAEGDLPSHTHSSQLLTPPSHTTSCGLFPSVLGPLLLGATEGEGAASPALSGDSPPCLGREVTESPEGLPRDGSSKWVLGESLWLPFSTRSYVPP